MMIRDDGYSHLLVHSLMSVAKQHMSNIFCFYDGNMDQHLPTALLSFRLSSLLLLSFSVLALACRVCSLLVTQLAFSKPELFAQT